MRKSNCLLPKLLFALALSVALGLHSDQPAAAQGDGVIPANYESGSFFNRKLGTALRFNYHTQGYGVQDDVFSLGGMKVFNMEGATAFVDGQGTLSDDFGGGFNLGVGYRQLTTLGTSFDPQRIMGASLWTDGQSTANDNFYTQLGFALESLGDAYDLRLNGHFPLERTKEGDPILTGSGTPFFSGNNIFGAEESVGIDTALDVLDAEIAVRVADLEAWAFTGAYYVGGGSDDTAGYRAGMRGYALPDLAVSLQVSDDDIYATNVMFGVTWFIGRTHKGNAPCGTLLDRFREPVIRNDFIAMETSRITRATGNALTSPDDNEAIRLVHVDSSAGAGGDGSFENPFDQISDVDAINDMNSLEGDIILVHGGSTFVGADGRAMLQDNQTVLGEGVDQNGNQIPHIVGTNELGNITLPETMAADPGNMIVSSLDMARPAIDATGGTAFTLADNNTINNFTIDNASTAITATPDDLATDPMDTLQTPTLQNLQINSPGTGVLLDQIGGTALVENTVEINGATVTALDITGGADGMSIGATINDSTGRSLSITERTGGTIDYTGTIDDDTDVSGDFSDGVLVNLNEESTINMTGTHNIRVDGGLTGVAITNNVNSTVNVSGTQTVLADGTGSAYAITNNDNSTINGSGQIDATGMTDAGGVNIAQNSANTTIDFADLNATAVDGDTVSVQDGGTVTIASVTTTDPDRRIANTGTGRAFFNSGGAMADDNAIVTVNSNITNDGGGLAVEVRDRTANDITFTGTVGVDNMLADSGGLLIQDNTDGNIIFTNTLTLNTGTENAVVLLNNVDGVAMTTATISFSDLDIDTTDGDGFAATGGGNLIVTSTNGTNDISVNGMGTALNLDGMTIDPANAIFDVVNAGGGAANGVILRDLDGTGLVTVGSGADAGDGGTLTTTGAAITVDNAANVQIDNMMVSNGATTGEGVVVTRQATGSLATFNNLDVTTQDATAIAIGDGMAANSNEDGAITFGTLAVATTGDGDGLNINNEDTSTAAIITNNVTVDVQDLANSNTARGYVATGGGTISMGGVNVINSEGGTSFVANDVRNLNASNVTIANTAAAGVDVSGQNQAGDSVTLNNFNVTTETADAMTISGNTDGTVIVTNSDAEATGIGGDAVVVDNNTGSTVSFNSITATAATGNAFSATNGGTLIATGTNNATSAGGQALVIEDMTIDAANVAFASVDASGNSVDPSIELSNLTGGLVSVNGGTIENTASAIAISNVEQASFNNMNLDSSAADTITVSHTSANDSDISFTNVTVIDGVQGIDVTANGTGELDLTFNNVDISGVSAEGLAFATGANTDRVDVTLINSEITVDDAAGFQATLSGSATADVRFAINDNTIENNSAASAALEMNLTSGMLVSARIGRLLATDDDPPLPLGNANTFTNTVAGGDPLRIEVSAGTMQLDLRDNTAQGGSTEFELTQTGGTFNLVDSADTLGDINNVGTVNDSGVINNINPPILAPTP